MEFYLKKTFIMNVIAFPYKNKLAEESCPYLWNGKNDKNINYEVFPRISISNFHTFLDYLVYERSPKLQNNMHYVNDISDCPQN